MQHETRQHLKTCNTKQQEKMTVERRRYSFLFVVVVVGGVVVGGALVVSLRLLPAAVHLWFDVDSQP
jgi:uncharacterized protein (DUF983 family)